MKLTQTLGFFLLASVFVVTAPSTFADTGMMMTGMNNTGMMMTGMDNTGMMMTGMNNTGMMMSGMDNTGMMMSGMTQSGIMMFRDMILNGMSAMGMKKVMFKDEQNSKRMMGGILVKDSQDAITFMYMGKLTRYATKADFMEDKALRRDEAAAFYVRFARDVLGMMPNTSMTGCMFTDLDKGHADLKGEVVAACQLGLFKGSKGEFMPTSELTIGQALTVLIRLVDGMKTEPTNDNWATNYWMAAQKLGLTQGSMADMKSNLDMKMTRGGVAKLIEAAGVIEAARTWATEGEKVRYMNGTGGANWEIGNGMSDDMSGSNSYELNGK